MVGVEHVFGKGQILLDLGALVPRNRQDPVEIIAHDRRLGRHRRHLTQFLQFGGRLVARLLGEFRRLDLFLDLGEIVLAVLAVAEFLLDRLHLLVEVIFALRLLHLALDARANTLLDLQDRDFALHQAEALLQPLGDRRRLEDMLLVDELDRKMGGDGVGELAVIGDLGHRRDDLGRHFLVELHIAFEFRHDGAGERLDLHLVVLLVGDDFGIGLVEIFHARISAHDCPGDALDEHFHRAVRQFEQLQHAGERAGLIDRFGRRIIVGRIHLCREQDMLVLLHHLFERANRLLAPDEERHDHMRKNDDVA